MARVPDAPVNAVLPPAPPLVPSPDSRLGVHAVSIVCTRFSLSRLVIIVALSVLLGGCLTGSDTSEPTATAVIALPEATESVLDATSTPAVTPEPTRSAALEALLAPGPTSPAPDGVFFQSGDEIWYQPPAEAARRVVEGQRIGPWAQTVDGTRLALVRYRDQDGAGVEEIILVNNDGTSSDPIYGPVATTGTGGDPAVQALDWSWDSQALSAILSDGTIATMRFAADDPFRTRPPLEPVNLPENGGEPVALEWAPNGAGIAYTLAGDNGYRLYVTPVGDLAQAVVTPATPPSRAVRDFAWLPGRGRLAFVEAAGGPANHLTGSIFTIAPDGMLLELLISAGQFAPAATIANLSAGPDGRDLAFTVQVPNAQGQQVFQSLWILSIDSGDLQQVPVETGYQVVDLIWSSSGLIWRGIDRNSRVPADGQAFTGNEPFILGRFDPANGTSTIIHQSALAGSTTVADNG
jgi:hypothetical protein